MRDPGRYPTSQKLQDPSQLQTGAGPVAFLLGSPPFTPNPNPHIPDSALATSPGRLSDVRLSPGYVRPAQSARTSSARQPPLREPSGPWQATCRAGPGKQPCAHRPARSSRAGSARLAGKRVAGKARGNFGITGGGDRAGRPAPGRSLDPLPVLSH